MPVFEQDGWKIKHRPIGENTWLKCQELDDGVKFLKYMMLTSQCDDEEISDDPYGDTDMEILVDFATYIMDKVATSGDKVDVLKAKVEELSRAHSV